MWFLYLLFLLVSFLPLSTGYNINRRRESNAKPLILGYLKHYAGKNSDQLTQFPGYSPTLSYTTPEAQDGANAIYNALAQSRVDSDFATGDENIVIDMKVYINFGDITQQDSALYDNSDGNYDIVIVASTHGFWVLRLYIPYGEKVYEEYNDNLKKKGLSADANPLKSSTAFDTKLKDIFFKDGPGASPKNFRKFCKQLDDVGGRIARVAIIGKKDPSSSTKKSAINKTVLGAIKHTITSYKYHIGVDAQSFRTVFLTWSEKDPPFNNRNSRKFLATFFYNNVENKWVSLSMYGSELAIFRPVTHTIDPDATPPELWQNSKELQPSKEGAVYELVVWGQGAQEAQAVAFSATSTKASISTSGRLLGPAIILFTDKGYFLAWYSCIYYSLMQKTAKAQREALAQFTEKVRNAVAAFEGAMIVDIIMLVSTTREERVIGGEKKEGIWITTGRFLDQLLRIVQKETRALLPNAPELTQARLIIGSTTGVDSLQKHFIILSDATKDPRAFTIYFKNTRQFQVWLTMDGRADLKVMNLFSVNIGELDTTNLEPRLYPRIEDCDPIDVNWQQTSD